MTRVLPDLIRALLNVIPNEFESKNDLEMGFSNIIASVPYTPPEGQHLLWLRLANLLEDHILITENCEEWRSKVLDIVNNKLNYRNYLTLETEPQWKNCIKRPVVVQFREVRPGEGGVETLEGYKPCNPDKHYIIRGVRGEEYPIEKAIFQETYDVIHATDPNKNY